VITTIVGVTTASILILLGSYNVAWWVKPELPSLNHLQHLCSVLPFTKSKYDA